MRVTDLGEAFRMIMKGRGWSQTRLGRELGHGQTWVSRVIRGEIDPGLRAARAYLDKVGWQLHMTPSRNSTNEGGGALKVRRSSGGRAVEFAHRGLGIPGISDESRVFLTGFLARSLANVPGQERQVHTEVDHALNMDTLSAVDRADILGIAGRALRDTGERREALKMLENAIDLGASYSPYLQTLFLGDQIMIVLDMRDPARAASLMNTLSA